MPFPTRIQPHLTENVGLRNFSPTLEISEKNAICNDELLLLFLVCFCVTLFFIYCLFAFSFNLVSFL